MTGLGPPRKLRIEIGRDCALRCIHCSAYATPGHPLTMPLVLAQRLVREFAEMGGSEVTFTGGEPFVHPNLPLLLDDARAAGLASVVFTSGIVHDETGRAAVPKAYFESVAGIVGSVVFSVYSVDAPTHDTITHFPGSLELTREGIRRAVSAGIPAEIHFVPTRANYPGLPYLIKDARTLGVRAVRVIRYVPQGRGSTNQDALRLTFNQQKELKRILREAAKSADILVRIGSGFGYLLEEAPPCMAALDEMVVAADGRIYPCSGFADYHGRGAIGSVHGSSLAEIWNESPYLQAVRGLLTARPPGGAERCVGCLAQKAAASVQITDSTMDPDMLVLSPPAAA